MPFNTEVSINLADDPELLSLMVEAGFDTVFVGIETPNEDSLAECSKNQNKGRDLVESVKRTPARRSAGAGRVHRRLRQRFPFDLPTADRFHPEERHRDGHGRAAAGPLGTRLYERMKREGRLVERVFRATTWMARPTSSPGWAWNRCARAIARS